MKNLAIFMVAVLTLLILTVKCSAQVPVVGSVEAPTVGPAPVIKKAKVIRSIIRDERGEVVLMIGNVEDYSALPWSAFNKDDEVYVPGMKDSRAAGKVFGPYWMYNVEERLLIDYWHKILKSTADVLYVRKKK